MYIRVITTFMVGTANINTNVRSGHWYHNNDSIVVDN